MYNLLMICGYALGAFLIYEAMKVIAYERLSSEQKLEYHWKHIRRILIRRFHMDDAKTIYELLHEKTPELSVPELDSCKAEMIQAMEAYYSVRFGNQPCSKELIAQTAALEKHMEKLKL